MLSLAGEAFSEPLAKGKLSTFLAAPIGEHEGQPVSVNELLGGFSHVLGGVHGGTPSSPVEQVLLTTVSSVPSAKIIGLGALRGVGTVIVRALRPTADALRVPHEPPQRRKTPTQPEG